MTSPTVRVRNGPAVAHYPPGATLGPRVLPCFEFVWMLAGRASWQHLPGAGDPTAAAPRTLDPGTLLLARPGMAEHYTWDPDRACAHAYVSFYVDSSGPLGDPDRWPLTRELSDPLAALCRYLLWLRGSDAAAAPERIVDVLGFVLDLFVRGPAPDDEDDALGEHLLRLVDQLRVAWRDGRTRALALPELAAAAQVSPGHLSRLFRQRSQVGPVAAVEMVRLARAAILLQRSNLSIGEISAACGFVNPFHFSRRFRAVYATAPRTYRMSRHSDPLDPLRAASLLALARPLLAEDI